jgi:uncharacterized protein YjbI with pentapeptide repeats
VDRQNTDLRRRSLAGADLRAARLAGADLRGADLSKADLRDADLSGARAGMSRRWAALLVTGAMLLSIGVGVAAGLFGRWVIDLAEGPDVFHRIAAWVVAVVIFVFVLVAIGKGLWVAARVLPVTGGAALVLGLIAIATGLGPGTGALLAVALLVLATIVLLLSVFARAVAGTLGGVAFVAVALAGAAAGGLLRGGAIAVVLALGAVIIARRSANRHETAPWLEEIIAALACRGGTRFADADLRGARFDGAQISACDFRGANLEGTSLSPATTQYCRFDEALSRKPRVGPKHRPAAG